MKTKLSMIGFGMAASVAVLSAPTAVAVQGYATDPFGNVVKDPFGKCVETPYVDKANVPVECGGVAPVAVVQPPAPTMITETMVLEADTNFDFDKAVLKPAGQETLSLLAEDVRRADDVDSISVVGHTDSIGTEAYNQGLSERRAAAVRDFLVEQGVDPSLIRTRGMGESQPVASNANRDGRAENRRVEITVEAQQKVMRQQ